MEIWASKCQVQPLRVVLLPRGALVQVWVRRKARIPAGRKSSSEYQLSVLWEMWGDGRSKVFLPQKCWQHLTEHRLKYLPCKSSAFSVESPSCSLETFKKWVEIRILHTSVCLPRQSASAKPVPETGKVSVYLCKTEQVTAASLISDPSCGKTPPSPDFPL